MKFKTKYNRYLPKELNDLIWSYDDRYKKQYKLCVYELESYFNKNRLYDHMLNNIMLYNLFNKLLSGRIWKKTFSEYHLNRIKTHGCRMDPNNLNSNNLKKVQIVS